MPLEFVGAEIAQRRMAATVVVEAFDAGKDVHVALLNGTKLLMVDQLSLVDEDEVTGLERRTVLFALRKSLHILKEVPTMRKSSVYSLTLFLAIVIGLIPAVTSAQSTNPNVYFPIVIRSGEVTSRAGIDASQSQALLDLIEYVRSLNLKPQLENGLIAKLEEALKVLTDNNPNNDHVAIHKLRDFIKQVTNQRGSRISEADVDALIAQAETIIASLKRISVELNDRNAYDKGARGIALVESVAEEGIIKILSLEVFDLVPDQQYYVWYVVQDDGAFDPNLDISPNFFRATVTSDSNGGFSIGGTFPGPAAALEPDLYRVDIFVTYTVTTAVLDEDEANLIRSANLYGSYQPLQGLDLLLSSTPFSTGIEVTVPQQE